MIEDITAPYRFVFTFPHHKLIPGSSFNDSQMAVNHSTCSWVDAKTRGGFERPEREPVGRGEPAVGG